MAFSLTKRLISRDDATVHTSWCSPRNARLRQILFSTGTKRRIFQLYDGNLEESDNLMQILANGSEKRLCLAAIGYCDTVKNILERTTTKLIVHSFQYCGGDFSDW
jgi:hypothetical protein